jgi:hypothetical protein
LSSQGELAGALTIFRQGDAYASAAVPFGDGGRCASGTLLRLYALAAAAGVASAPGVGDMSITQRSAALGDVIAPGSARFYQAWYRDPAPAFCPAPLGGTSNVSNALRVQW